MRRNVIRTSLGDLIVAVTDAVMPVIEDPTKLYAVVACVVNDVLAHRQPGARNRVQPKHPRRSFQLH